MLHALGVGLCMYPPCRGRAVVVERAHLSVSNHCQCQCQWHAQSYLCISALHQAATIHSPCSHLRSATAAPRRCSATASPFRLLSGRPSTILTISTVIPTAAQY